MTEKSDNLWLYHKQLIMIPRFNITFQERRKENISWICHMYSAKRQKNFLLTTTINIKNIYNYNAMIWHFFFFFWETG